MARRHAFLACSCVGVLPAARRAGILPPFTWVWVAPRSLTNGGKRGGYGRVVQSVMADVSYTLRDLIAAASAAERLTLGEHVIRQYVAEGLLAPPRGRGMTAAYAEEHLAQLRLVLRLASQYVPLPEIRRWMQTLTVGQLQALLDRPGVPRLPAEGDTQAYLARLLKTLPPAIGRAQAATPSGVPLRAPPPRAPRRAAAIRPPDPAPAAERTVWLRVAVSAEVELLVRAHGAGLPAQTIDRLVAAVQAVLAGGVPDPQDGHARQR